MFACYLKLQIAASVRRLLLLCRASVLLGKVCTPLLQACLALLCSLAALSGDGQCDSYSRLMLSKLGMTDGQSRCSCDTGIVQPESAARLFTSAA